MKNKININIKGLTYHNTIYIMYRFELMKVTRNIFIIIFFFIFQLKNNYDYIFFSRFNFFKCNLYHLGYTLMYQ